MASTYLFHMNAYTDEKAQFITGQGDPVIITPRVYREDENNQYIKLFVAYYNINVTLNLTYPKFSGIVVYDNTGTIGGAGKELNVKITFNPNNSSHFISENEVPSGSGSYWPEFSCTIEFFNQDVSFISTILKDKDPTFTTATSLKSNITKNIVSTSGVELQPTNYVPLTLVTDLPGQDMNNLSSGYSDSAQLILGVYPNSFKVNLPKRIVRLNAPGRDGDIIQDMGLGNMEVTFSGKLLGISHYISTPGSMNTGSSITAGGAFARAARIGKGINQIPIEKEIEVLRKIHKSRFPVRILSSTQNNYEWNLINQLEIMSQSSDGGASKVVFSNPEISKFVVTNLSFGEVGGRANEVTFSISLLRFTIPKIKKTTVFLPFSSRDVCGSTFEELLAARLIEIIGQGDPSVLEADGVDGYSTHSPPGIFHLPITDPKYLSSSATGAYDNTLEKIFGVPKGNQSMFSNISSQILNATRSSSIIGILGFDFLRPTCALSAKLSKYKTIHKFEILRKSKKRDKPVAYGQESLLSTWTGGGEDIDETRIHSLTRQLKSSIYPKTPVGGTGIFPVLIPKETFDAFIKDIRPLSEQLTSHIEDSSYRDTINYGSSVRTQPYLGQDYTGSFPPDIEAINNAIANKFNEALVYSGVEPLDLSTVIGCELLTIEHIKSSLNSAVERAMLAVSGSVEGLTTVPPAYAFYPPVDIDQKPNAWESYSYPLASEEMKKITKENTN